jgi:hypothetical protein
MSVPEFAVNPLAQVHKIVLSHFGFTRNFSNKELNIVLANLEGKIRREIVLLT